MRGPVRNGFTSAAPESDDRPSATTATTGTYSVTATVNAIAPSAAGHGDGQCHACRSDRRQ